MKHILGKILGGLLILGMVAVIGLWPRKKVQPVAPDPIRPVRSVVVSSETHLPDLVFPGVVKAGADRTLAFEVPGRILSIPVSKNQRVRKGAILAKLDPKDFADKVEKAKAALDRDNNSVARYHKVAPNAVSREEVSRAEAQAKTSQTEYDCARRDLDRTVLTAPFDGVVADTYPSELDVVPVGEKVALVLDMKEICIEVSLPETIVIRAKMFEKASLTNVSHVVFDSYPGHSYPARLDEFTAVADVRTQIYKTRFRLPNVPELNLLPGMSATVTIHGSDYVYRDGPNHHVLSVPSCAAGVDGTGGHFVWRLDPVRDEVGVFCAHKSPVSVVARVGTDFVLESGVRSGDRIATAGVSVLSEGRKVLLLKESTR